MFVAGSRLRPPTRLGVAALARVAADAGLQGLAIDAGCVLGDLAGVCSEGMVSGLPLVGVRAPLPAGRLAPGKRLPYLAAIDDAEERLAAVTQAQDTMQVARDLGARLVTLEFGRVGLGVPDAVLRRFFARRALDEDEEGAPALARALSQRKALSPMLVDACRKSLDALVRTAEKTGMRLALTCAARVWQVPSPREAITLLGDFSGAPVGSAFAPARLAALEHGRLPASADVRQALARAAVIIEASDGVGIDADLAPGLGEYDLTAIADCPADAPIIVSGRADTSTDELARARQLCEPIAARRAAR